MAKNQLFWLGPGVYGFGKNKLNPGDPLPQDFSEKDLKRFSKTGKIGEKIAKGILPETKNLKKEIKSLNEKIKELEKENQELKATITELESQNPGGEE